MIRNSSLGTKVQLLGWGTAIAVLTFAGVLMALSLRARSDLDDFAEHLVQEQTIADEINRAVLRQLATSASLGSSDAAAERSEYEAAGEEINDHVRRYLLRPLFEEERVQLERLREAHQRMEVANSRALELFSRGLVGEAHASMAESVEHTEAFLRALDRFLALRAAERERLRLHQDTLFDLVLGGIGVLAFLLLAGSSFAAMAFHRRVAVPLGELSNATERIGAGDLTVRLTPGPDRELKELAERFNRMGERLDRSRTEVESRNHELGVALESLRRAQAELIQSEKLGAIGRMTAGLAHELNNPLGSVVGYAQLLSRRMDVDGPPSEAELKEDYVVPILQEADRAYQLVRNFLHFARADSPGLEAVRVRDALEVVERLRAFSFEQRGLELSVESLPPSLHVLAEPQTLQSVILNLVNNAFDAMQEQGSGTLRIRGEVTGASADLIFEDDGPGMERPDLVFDAFYTTKPVGEGTGLGLSLVHQAMERFDGSVQAENRAEGGARFVLRFRTATPPRVQPETEGAGGEAAPSLDTATPTPPTAGTARPRILVVEDEASVRTLHRRILAQLDAEVYLAESAARAKEILAEKEVDAILCDVRMPGEDGVSFFRWLEGAHPELARSRFLFVTGDTLATEILGLRHERPDAFLQKPFQLDEYLAKVRTLLRDE